MQVKETLNNGCSEKDIMQVVLQSAICCDVPAPVDSFRVAREVFMEIDSEQE